MIITEYIKFNRFFLRTVFSLLFFGFVLPVQTIGAKEQFSDKLKNSSFRGGKNHWLVEYADKRKSGQMYFFGAKKSSLPRTNINDEMFDVNLWQRDPSAEMRLNCEVEEKSSGRSFHVFMPKGMDREATLSFDRTINIQPENRLYFDAIFKINRKQGRAVAILEFDAYSKGRMAARMAYYFCGTPGHDWLGDPNRMFTDSLHQSFFYSVKVLPQKPGEWIDLKDINIIADFNENIAEFAPGNKRWQDLNVDSIKLKLRHDVFSSDDIIDIEYKDINIKAGGSHPLSKKVKSKKEKGKIEIVDISEYSSQSLYNELTPDIAGKIEKAVLFETGDKTIVLSQKNIKLAGNKKIALSFYYRNIDSVKNPLVSLENKAGRVVAAIMVNGTAPEKGWSFFSEKFNVPGDAAGYKLKIKNFDGSGLFAGFKLFELPDNDREIEKFLKENSELPILKIEIKEKDLERMQEAIDEIPAPSNYSPTNRRILSDEFKLYVPAVFYFQQERLEGKIRYRGMLDDHWTGRKRSYKVVFGKGYSLEGMKSLNLIIPEDDNGLFYGFALNRLVSEFGLHCPESEFSALFLNGEYKGVYWKSYDFDDKFLEKSCLPAGNIYKPVHLDSTLFGIADLFPYKNIGWWKKKSKFGVASQKVKGNDYSELYTFINVLEDQNPRRFAKDLDAILDYEQFSRWFAFSLLCGDWHLYGTNFIFYFNSAKGLFEFFPWDVVLGTVQNHFENHKIAAPYVWFPPAIAKIIENTDIFDRSRGVLRKYLKNDEAVRRDVQELVESLNEVRTAYYADDYYPYDSFETNLRLIKNDFIYNIEFIKKNLDKGFDEFLGDLRTKNDPAYKKLGLQPADNEKRDIEDFASKGRVFLNVDTAIQDDKDRNYFGFIVVNAAPCDILFRKLVLKYKSDWNMRDIKIYRDANDNGILDGADKLLKLQSVLHRRNKVDIRFGEPISQNASKILKDGRMNFVYFPENRVRFFVDFKHKDGNDIRIKKLSAGFKNMKNTVNIERVYCRYYNSNDFRYFKCITMTAKEFASLYPIFVPAEGKKNSFILPEGRYALKDNIIIPKGIELDISPGAVLSFAENRSMICYGKIVAEGTPEAPILFTSLKKGGSWGVMGLIQAEAGGEFRNCIFEYGSDAYINGVYFSGMFDAYYCNVDVKRCIFRYASMDKGDDSLNFKKGVSRISECAFIKNNFDAIDFDFMSQGSVIENCYFLDNGNDGVDISGSSVLIERNWIERSHDKGISVGENSQNVIFNNLIIGCDSGIAVKDLSAPKIINNTLVDNNIGVSVYQKKPLFGGGKANVYNCVLDNRKLDFAVEEKKGREDRPSTCFVANSRFRLRDSSCRELIKAPKLVKNKGKKSRYEDLLAGKSLKTQDNKFVYAELQGNDVKDAGNNTDSVPLFLSPDRNEWKLKADIGVRPDGAVIAEAREQGFNIALNPAEIGITGDYPDEAFFKSLLSISERGGLDAE